MCAAGVALAQGIFTKAQVADRIRKVEDGWISSVTGGRAERSRVKPQELAAVALLAAVAPRLKHKKLRRGT